MELRLLRCFVAVADAGSVTAAAAELYVSQPALSRQLHRLEREIDLVLFRPADGRLVITSAGRELLPRARTLLAGATALRALRPPNRVRRNGSRPRSDDTLPDSQASTDPDLHRRRHDQPGNRPTAGTGRKDK
ncbi:MAG TPA: LysR family transcriptional regulator [Nakamurella sp.]